MATRREPKLFSLRVDWHIGERDFLPAVQNRLLAVARHAVQGAPLAFTFDRPRRPVQLAEGIDRRHPAVLLTVGLHLPRLAEQVLTAYSAEPPGSQAGPAPPSPPSTGGARGGGEDLLAEARQSGAHGSQCGGPERDFLRRHGEDRPALTSGFLLDRARLVVAPVGLESCVRTFTGQGLCAGSVSLEFGKQMVQRMLDVLRADGSVARWTLFWIQLPASR